MNAQGHCVISKDAWQRVSMQHVEKLPCDVDGLSLYSLYSDSRPSLLEKCRDGRPWKRDTKTNWRGYENVRYRNCGGSPSCPNSECRFIKEFGSKNRLKFDRSNVCNVCGALGELIQCPARKYTALKNARKAHVYHYGEHTCQAKALATRPTDLVSRSIAVDPSIKPSSIQGNAVLMELRKRKPWSEVENMAKKVVSKKAISNEKLKQKKLLQSKGTSFNGTKEYKCYTDAKDPFLIYAIDENQQYVFKTSRVKMEIAAEMQSDGGNVLSTEFCCFDGKVNRTRYFTTLTASVYHPFLQKQVPLAIMDCKSEDTECVELFWRLFNKAFKEVNNSSNKFQPSGWITDMATANFSGLERIYGEEVLEKIKGCEFHFRSSVHRHSACLTEDDKVLFHSLSEQLLVSSSREAYDQAHTNLKAFIDENDGRRSLESWLAWWHDRRQFIFRAFTGFDKPRMNQAEVVHASWANRDAKGLPLLEAAEFDARDTIILEAQLKAISTAARGFGCGPDLAEIAERRAHRESESANRKGQDLLDHGVEGPTCKRRYLPGVDPTGGCNPPKRGIQDAERMFVSRREAALRLAETMKVRRSESVSNLKRVYHVTSSASGKKLYKVTISNTPCCTCPDFEKHGSKVVCKHIIFIFIHVLNGHDYEKLLQDRYLATEDIRNLFTNAGNDIPSRYQQEKAPKRQKREFDVILKDYESYDEEQTWFFHVKSSRSALCTANDCKKVIHRGTECFSVDGALTVPYNGNRAVKQKFYYCLSKNCMNRRPPWTNIRSPTSFTSGETISEERKQEVGSLLGLNPV